MPLLISTDLKFDQKPAEMSDECAKEWELRKSDFEKGANSSLVLEDVLGWIISNRTEKGLPASLLDSFKEFIETLGLQEIQMTFATRSPPNGPYVVQKNPDGSTKKLPAYSNGKILVRIFTLPLTQIAIEILRDEKPDGVPLQEWFDGQTQGMLHAAFKVNLNHTLVGCGPWPQYGYTDKTAGDRDMAAAHVLVYSE